MKLTLKSVGDARLPAGTTDMVFWDDDIAGFGLRIRQGGTRTWIYRYRIGKQQYSMTLGSATSVPLATARRNAADCEAKIRLGGNPAQDKETARIEANNFTVGFIDEYLTARQSEWRPNSLREVKRHLLVYAKPLHKQPISSVSQRSIASLLTDVAKSSGEVSSNRLRTSLAAFFTWIIRQGVRLPDGNVASFTEPRKEKTRERVLNDDEIKIIWRSCNHDDYGAIIKLLLLTGSRASEIGSLRWDEIQGSQILLPGSRTKNGRPHSIPLSGPAQAILGRLRIVDRSFVFGRTDTAGYKGWGKSKERLDERIAKAGATLPDWTVHDLRRTCATGMAGLKIQPHIIEAVLNHVSGHKAGVAGIYNRAAYDEEKREALNRWAEHVLAIVGNVR
jgi:integrase